MRRSFSWSIPCTARHHGDPGHAVERVGLKPSAVASRIQPVCQERVVED